MANSALAAMDAALHAALADSGLADAGAYTAPAGSPVAVRCYVDEAVQQIGDYGQAVAAQDVVTLLRADVSAPVSGAALVVDGKNYKLDKRQSEDSSISVWSVIRV